jgi:hypothetical protein
MRLNEKGLSLIFAIIFLLIVAVLAAVLASLVSTDADIAFHEFRSSEAQYVADGGIEYALETGIFPNYSFPPYSGRGATPSIALGDGSFFVDPPTVLTAAIDESATSISVVSTVSFGSPAITRRIVIGSELLDCTILNATTFSPCTRNQNSPPIVPPTNPDLDHAIDDSVYPATTLDGGLAAVAKIIPVATTVGYLIPGTITIDSEEIYCTGTDTNPAVCGAGKVACFTDCTRGYKGTTPIGHGDGQTVYQYVITSTGTVPTGIVGNAQRVVRVTVGLLD